MSAHERLRLAGLDTVILDLNRDGPCAPMPAVSPSSRSFLVSSELSPLVTLDKQTTALRVARKPLGDRTPELNIAVGALLFRSEQYDFKAEVLPEIVIAFVLAWAVWQRNSIASTTSRLSRRDSQTRASIRLSSRPPSRKPSNSLINNHRRSRTLSRSAVYPSLPAVARTSTFSILPPLVTHFDYPSSSPRSRPTSFVGPSTTSSTAPATTVDRNQYRRVSVSSVSSPPSLLHRLSLHLRPEPLVFSPLRTSQVHDEPYIIPTLQHPNSPYMPWASTIRHQILRPLTPNSYISIPDGYYSRPLSRSGARAPSPILEHGDGAAFQSDGSKKGFGIKAGRKVKNLGGALLRNVGGLAKRVTKRKAKLTISTRDIPVAPASILSPPASPRLLLMLPPLPSPSIQSILVLPALERPSDDSGPSDETLDSPNSDFHSLEEWLEERRRLEDIATGGSSIVRMTLEEYEMRGSWLQLVPREGREDGWTCGVRGCCVHERDSGYFAEDIEEVDDGRSLHRHEEHKAVVERSEGNGAGSSLGEEADADGVSGLPTSGTLGHTDEDGSQSGEEGGDGDVCSVTDCGHRVGIAFPIGESSRSEEGSAGVGERQWSSDVPRVWTNSL